MGVRAMLTALPTVIKERHRAELYRSYVADCLQSISRNVAPIGRGDYIAKRWADISDPKPSETRTPQEIIAHMKQKIASV